MIHDFTKVKNIYIICGRTDMRKGIDNTKCQALKQKQER